MNPKHLFFTILLTASLIVSGCGPSVEEAATFTAAAWTSTPNPTSTPTPTSTLTPTSTPTSTPTATPIGGGFGQLVFDTRRCQTEPSCEFSVYNYDFQSSQSSLLFEGYQLQGISPDGNKLLVSRVVQVGIEKYNSIFPTWMALTQFCCTIISIFLRRYGYQEQIGLLFWLM